MAFSDKAALKTSLAAWLARASISSTADDVITLAEARLNRELGEVLTDQSLTGTIDSAEISVSAYSVAAPIALFLAESGLDETPLQPLANGSFPRSVTSGRPVAWSYVRGTDKIVLDRPLDQAYPFRLHFRQRFSLAGDGDTNWLLSKHPDIYLSACIMWGGLFVQDDEKVGAFAAILEQGIPSVNAYIAAQSPAELRIDPALVAIGGRGGYNLYTDQ